MTAALLAAVEVELTEDAARRVAEQTAVPTSMLLVTLLLLAACCWSARRSK